VGWATWGLEILRWFLSVVVGTVGLFGAGRWHGSFAAWLDASILHSLFRPQGRWEGGTAGAPGHPGEKGGENRFTFYVYVRDKKHQELGNNRDGGGTSQGKIQQWWSARGWFAFQPIGTRADPVVGKKLGRGGRGGGDWGLPSCPGEDPEVFNFKLGWGPRVAMFALLPFRKTKDALCVEVVNGNGIGGGKGPSV